jgi:putative ABC transport system permease protein
LEPVAYTLAENIPSIEAATNYFDRLMQVKLGNSYMDARWLEVSEDFFTVLDFGVLSGDPKHILSREGVANNEVFITERLAELLFGSEDPLGKILPTTQGQEYVVSGIFRTPPVTNPLDDFDIVSFRDYDPTTANWQGDDSYPTFIKLRKGITKSQAEAEIQRLIEEHPTLRKMVELWKANYFLVPIEDVVYVDNNIRQTQMIYGILAVLALLVATLNYVL